MLEAHTAHQRRRATTPANPTAVSQFRKRRQRIHAARMLPLVLMSFLQPKRCVPARAEKHVGCWLVQNPPGSQLPAFTAQDPAGQENWRQKIGWVRSGRADQPSHTAAAV